MPILPLCHRFFHFSLARWTELWGGVAPSERDLQRLFREELLARRCRKEEFPRSLDEARAIHHALASWDERMGVRALVEGSPDYPAAVIDHMPPERRPAVLYLRGAPLPTEEKSLAVVGTRAPSAGGVEAAGSFAAYFTLLGIQVVSGLAKGIDTLAHRANLRAGTVAVLGSAVTEIYPAENARLAEQILGAGGSLLSPYPTGQVPLPANFPQRNELIASLSAGTLVVEGAEKSGAAITGKQALAMGKNVVVLTSDFRTAFGRGAIRLQQCGATLVADEEEAVQALYARLGGFAGARPAKIPCTARRTFTLAEYGAAAGLPYSDAIASLQEEILKGKVIRTGPDRYRPRG